MCCFSGPVAHVSDTRIYARSDGPRQRLCYEARVSAASPLAMVLPVPTADLRFVDLSGFPRLFDALAAAFPAPRARAPAFAKSAPPPPAPLPVVAVGAWEASFVPRRERFSDLDPRFRLSDGVLDALGSRYDGWGFAVFRLQPGDQRLHPLGLDFLRRDPGRLFFPTVHVHDGSVPAEATFDHALYAQDQRGEHLRFDRSWEESPRGATDDVGGTLLAGRHVYRRVVTGSCPNVDTWL